MSDWYLRQTGDKELFALTFSLGRDPHPAGDPELSESWGGLGIWVRNRCLTRSVSRDGGVSDEVRWQLAPVLEWLIEIAVRLVNEEPFPCPAPENYVGDACSWFDLTERPQLTLLEAEEDKWFMLRSEWRQHHALRRAALDVALPNVMARRLEEHVELSWDNQTWPTSRRDLSFVEMLGAELVPARQFSAVLTAALRDVTRALSERHPGTPRWSRLAESAQGLGASEDDWRWLVHRQTAGAITRHLPRLADALREHVRAAREGLYIPHSAQTQLLRQALLVSPEEIQEAVGAAQLAESAPPLSEELRRLVLASPAPVQRPWTEGYDRALELRERLGWGGEPCPDLTRWMKTHNVEVRDIALSTTIDLFTRRTSDHRALVVVNTAAQQGMRREIAPATALGHLLMDPWTVSVDGVWEHSPTSRRARAFGAMLLMPEDGVRDLLAGTGSVDAEVVKRVMDHFNAGLFAATYHLKNLGLIPTDDRRVGLIKELSV